MRKTVTIAGDNSSGSWPSSMWRHKFTRSRTATKDNQSARKGATFASSEVLAAKTNSYQHRTSTNQDGSYHNVHV